MSDKSDLKTLVPSFIIHLNGSRLAAEREADIKEITIIEKVDSPSSFIIKVSDMKRQWADNEDFAEGSKIKITLGYKDNVEELFNGEITGLIPEFKRKSDDVLILKGYNQLHRLNRSKKNRPFTDKNDVDIIKQIANEASLKTDIDNIGNDHVFTMQRNQTNYEYLTIMSKKYNCKLWAKDDKLYFKKTEGNSGEDIVVEYGKTLIEFFPVLDSTKLFTEVEVRGWNINQVEGITGSAVLDDIQLKIGNDKLGGKAVKDNFGDEKAVFIDENIIDQNGADQAALDILTGNSFGYINASGKCEGNTKIRAGSIIQVKEVSDKFSGKYYVDSVKHILSTTHGYSTVFELSRNTI